MLSSVLVVLAAAAGLVSAQSGTGTTTNFTTCCAINPESETSDTLLSWCRAQTNTCPLLCQNGQTANNTCDPDTLVYNCTCLTGTTPNISNYGETLPSLECEAWVGQCTTAHPNDLSGQTFCQSFVCGSQNASSSGAGASTASTATSTSTGSSTGSSSASSTTGSASAAASSKAAAAGPIYYGGREIGTCAMIVFLGAVFGFAL